MIKIYEAHECSTTRSSNSLPRIKRYGTRQTFSSGSHMPPTVCNRSRSLLSVGNHVFITVTVRRRPCFLLLDDFDRLQHDTTTLIVPISYAQKCLAVFRDEPPRSFLSWLQVGMTPSIPPFICSAVTSPLAAQLIMPR